MDERRQYVPSSIYTYSANDAAIGINVENIVREASNKENDYKNVKNVPIESIESDINKEKQKDLYKNL